VGGGLADVVHPAGVAVIAVADHRHVDVDDVTGLEALFVGDAVADHVIHRGADGLGESPVVEVRRHRALHRDDVVVADAIELLGGHTGNHVLGNHVEHVGGQPAGGAHLFLFLGRFDRHGHEISS